MADPPDINSLSVDDAQACHRPAKLIKYARSRILIDRKT
jgi:hypothetical protein